MPLVVSLRSSFSRRERTLAGVVSVGVGSSELVVEDPVSVPVEPSAAPVASAVAAAVAAAVVEDTAAGNPGRLNPWSVRLIELCGFGSLRNTVLGQQLVIGVIDVQLSEAQHVHIELVSPTDLGTDSCTAIRVLESCSKATTRG